MTRRKGAGSESPSVYQSPCFYKLHNPQYQSLKKNPSSMRAALPWSLSSWDSYWWNFGTFQVPPTYSYCFDIFWEKMLLKSQHIVWLVCESPRVSFFFRVKFPQLLRVGLESSIPWWSLCLRGNFTVLSCLEAAQGRRREKSLHGLYGCLHKLSSS